MNQSSTGLGDRERRNHSFSQAIDVLQNTIRRGWPTGLRPHSPCGILARFMLNTSQSCSRKQRPMLSPSVSLAHSPSLSPFAPSHCLACHGRRAKPHCRRVLLLRSSTARAKSATTSAFAFSLAPRRLLDRATAYSLRPPELLACRRHGCCCSHGRAASGSHWPGRPLPRPRASLGKSCPRPSPLAADAPPLPAESAAGRPPCCALRPFCEIEKTKDFVLKLEESEGVK